jgi:hypothetical protein
LRAQKCTLPNKMQKLAVLLLLVATLAILFGDAAAAVRLQLTHTDSGRGLTPRDPCCALHKERFPVAFRTPSTWCTSPSAHLLCPVQHAWLRQRPRLDSGPSPGRASPASSRPCPDSTRSSPPPYVRLRLCGVSGPAADVVMRRELMLIDQQTKPSPLRVRLRLQWRIVYDNHTLNSDTHSSLLGARPCLPWPSAAAATTPGFSSPMRLASPGLGAAPYYSLPSQLLLFHSPPLGDQHPQPRPVRRASTAAAPLAPSTDSRPPRSLEARPFQLATSRWRAIGHHGRVDHAGCPFLSPRSRLPRKGRVEPSSSTPAAGRTMFPQDVYNLVHDAGAHPSPRWVSPWAGRAEAGVALWRSDAGPDLTRENYGVHVWVPGRGCRLDLPCSTPWGWHDHN